MSLKRSNLMDLLRLKAELGEFVLMKHARERAYEREILLVDIVHVLMYGWHEARKDSFSEEFKAWNYAIRGKTVDEFDLRVIVSFDEDYLLIITVIRLGGSKDGSKNKNTKKVYRL